MGTTLFKYQRPELESLVEVINFTNKTDFKVDELSFDVPVVVEGPVVSVKIAEAGSDGFDNALELTYPRKDLALTFSKSPLVIDVADHDDESILSAIYDQHGVLFESIYVTIDKGDEPASPEPGATADYVLRANPESYMWFGETPLLVRNVGTLMGRSIKTGLAIRAYFGETGGNKVPIDLIYDSSKNASAYGKTLSALQVPATGPLVLTPDSLFVDVASALTGDVWVSEETEVPFNLNGSSVIYNGANSGEHFLGYPNYSHVIVVELGPLCQNLTGQWKIFYNDPTTFVLDETRPDRDPSLDF